MNKDKHSFCFKKEAYSLALVALLLLLLRFPYFFSLASNII